MVSDADGGQLMPYNFPLPPSGVTGPVRDYLAKLVTEVINHLPVFSYASLATPNSVYTGKVPDFFINIGSASTQTRLFMNIAPTTSTVSWATIRILPG